MSHFVTLEIDDQLEKKLESQVAGGVEPIIVDGELVAVRIGKIRLSSKKSVGIVAHLDVAQ